MDLLEAERVTAKVRYNRLTQYREFYLDQAERSAALTIPSLFPQSLDHGMEEKQPEVLPTPWQSFGAYGVESLAARYMLALFPANIPFARYYPSEDLLRQAKEEGVSDEDVQSLKLEIEEALGDRERAIMREVDTDNYRVAADETLRQLLVSGNELLHLPKDGGMRTFHLNRYVVRRGPKGKILELIVRESLAKDDLPEEIAALDPQPLDEGNRTTANHDQFVDLYTHIRLVGKRYEKYQEAFDQLVPGTEGTFPMKKLPWLALRWTAIEGEDYGRGFIEAYRGALRSLESLQSAVVHASVAASKVIWLVSTGGRTRIRTLENAPNGAYISGRADEIQALRLDKGADMQVALAAIDMLKQELSQAFLLTSSIQRNAERVTAEEIRRLAEDLETTQGGSYSLLSQDFQLPLVLRIEQRLAQQGKIATLKDGDIEAVIVTGLQAIGRSADLNSLREYLADVSGWATIIPAIVEHIDARGILKKLNTGHGVSEDGTVLSEEAVAANRQAAQRQQLMDKASDAVPAMMEQGAGGIMDQMMPGAAQG